MFLPLSNSFEIQFWERMTENALGQPLTYKMGNGKITTLTYDGNYLHKTSITPDIQNFSYNFRPRSEYDYNWHLSKIKKMQKIFIFLFIIFPINVSSQGITLEYNIGYGEYQLKDIKEMQNWINPYGYDLKVTDPFSGYIIHSFIFGYNIGYHHFGNIFAYLTTGSRLNRTDYSGSYTIDMIIDGYRFGEFYRIYTDTRISRLQFLFQITAGTMFTNLKVEEYLKIYSDSAKEITVISGVGLYLESTIGYRYCLKDFLHFSLSGGYEVDFFSKLKYKGLETGMKAKWNGLRLYGGFTIFPTKIKNKK